MTNAELRESLRGDANHDPEHYAELRNRMGPSPDLVNTWTWNWDDADLTAEIVVERKEGAEQVAEILREIGVEIKAADIDFILIGEVPAPATKISLSFPDARNLSLAQGIAKIITRSSL